MDSTENTKKNRISRNNDNNTSNFSDHWSRKSVVYQIYPMSFRDSQPNGVGDLGGIIEKLDYLNDGTEKSLGIDAIWLSPIYKSPMKDFGYDISDHCSINPLFGDLATFDRLIKEAHTRNIKVIMDYVPNHTSVEHPWFLESKSSRENPKRDWYIWRDPQADGTPPNNWISVFGGSGWEYDATTGQYYFHSFLKEQPDLNWRNPEVKAAMLSVLKFWIDRGVDGFRIDAVYHLIKDGSFLDEPLNPKYKAGKDELFARLSHIYTKGFGGLIEGTRILCEILNTYKNIFMVTEADLNLSQMIKVYNACSRKQYAPFNFNLINLKWKASLYKKFIDTFEAKLTPDDWPNYVLGNHDQSRLATRIGLPAARVAAMLLFSLRGMPFIYYGDEIGMEDGEIQKDQIKDGAEKQTPGIKIGRDPERTPMQWNSTTHAGFSTAGSWLPVGNNYKTHNVEDEEKDPYSILNLYKKLIHLRKKTPELLQGKYIPIESVSKDVFAFVREHDGKKILVVLNFGNKEIEEALQFPSLEIITNTHLNKRAGEMVSGKLILRPHEGYILKVL